MSSTNPSELITRVQALIAANQCNDALEVLNTHTREFSHSQESSHLKAVCLSRMARPLEAIYWARHALTQNQGFTPSLQLLLNLISQPEQRWVRAFIEKSD
jgi:hypothetical protein